jgi:hypothetical protein
LVDRIKKQQQEKLHLDALYRLGDLAAMVRVLRDQQFPEISSDLANTCAAQAESYIRVLAQDHEAVIYPHKFRRDKWEVRSGPRPSRGRQRRPPPASSERIICWVRRAVFPPKTALGALR